MPPSLSSQTIPWYQRLEARVLLTLLLLVGASTLAIVLAAGRVLKEYSLERSQRDMVAARTAFNELEAARADAAGSECRLIVELPIFRALMGDSRQMAHRDAATIEAMSEEYRQKLRADFCVTTDQKGRWIGNPAELSGTDAPSALAPAIRVAITGREYRGVADLRGEPYLVVAEPAQFAEEVLGTLCAGYRLNDATAAELAGVTGCEVSFLDEHQLFGTSLSPVGERSAQVRQALPASLSGWGDAPALRTLGGTDYVGAASAIAAGPETRTSARLLLLQPWVPTQRKVGRIQLLLLEIGGLTFLVAVLGGLVLSRRVTAPLRDLASAAETIAGGKWEAQAPVRGGAEAALTAAAFNAMMEKLRHYYRDAEEKSERLEATFAELQSSYGATLHALCRALDKRDNETEGHSERVAYYAYRIAHEMGLSQEILNRLEWGALLHDIGKIGVPDAILRKPGRLTDEEMAVMRRHCDWGAEIVQGVPHLEHTVEVIRHHHEWYNGHGYPGGLAGNRIPVIARIFAVADSLDAITSDRPYRAARSFAEAVEEIRRCSGTQFDPEIVTAFLRVSAELEAWRGENDRVGYTLPGAELLVSSLVSARH